MPPRPRCSGASPCRNSSKIVACSSSGMPMPVSETTSAQRSAARARPRGPRCGPVSVNLSALPIRFDSDLRELRRIRRDLVEARATRGLERQSLAAAPRRGSPPRSARGNAGTEMASRRDLRLARLDLRDVQDVVDERRAAASRCAGRARGSRAAPAFSAPWLPRRSVPVNPRMTVIGVRSSCETDARNRSFSALARWSSSRGARDAAALLLEQLVLLGETPRLLGDALVGRRVGERDRERRRDRGERVARSCGVNACVAPRASTPTTWSK